jgi:hypothetical protein
MQYAPAGGTLTIRFQVTGLDPTRGDNIVQAVGSVDAVTGVRIPQYQQPHPTIVGFTVMGYNTDPMGAADSPNLGGVWVDVVYGTPEFIPNSTLIEIEGITGTKTINVWPYGPQAGRPIMVGVQLKKGILDPSGRFSDQIPVTGGPLAPNGDSGSFYEVGEVPVISGGMVLKFTRRENVAPNILAIRRKVNQTQWQGLGPGLWLCWNVTAKNLISVGSIFPGGGYEVTYFFMTADLDLPNNLAGFTSVVLYKDSQTGRAFGFSDPTGGTNNGFTLVKPYGPYDFNSLKLPNVY